MAEGPSRPSGSAPRPTTEEVDSRSIFVGNLHYRCTPEEVEQYFEACGRVERVSIPENHYGPKGFCYVEFSNVEAVGNALNLNMPELRGRRLKVSPKKSFRCPMRRPSTRSPARGRPVRFGRWGRPSTRSPARGRPVRFGTRGWPYRPYYR